MKNICLLILLFIPLFCNGQNGEIQGNKIFNPKEDKTVKFYWYDYDLEECADSIEVVPISTFKKYQQECYNDSTLMIDRSCPGKLPGCLVNHYKEYYYHKVPTFEGFLKYLEE